MKKNIVLALIAAATATSNLGAWFLYDIDFPEPLLAQRGIQGNGRRAFNQLLRQSSLRQIVKPDHYLYLLEIPGRTNENVEISVNKQQNRLTVTIKDCESSQSKEEQEGNTKESFYQSSQVSSQSIELPDDCDLSNLATAVTAKVGKGMLHIVVKRLSTSEAPTESAEYAVAVADGDAKIS